MPAPTDIQQDGTQNMNDAISASARDTAADALHAIVTRLWQAYITPGDWSHRSQANLKDAVEVFREALFDYECVARKPHAHDARLPEMEAHATAWPARGEPQGSWPILRQIKEGMREETKAALLEVGRERRARGSAPLGLLKVIEAA